jgi:hypothetical protein
MPICHTVEVTSAGDRKISIYLDVKLDDPTNVVPFNAFEKLLGQIAEGWQDIVEAMDLKLIFVPSVDTEVLDKEVMSQELVLEEDATPNDRILYRQPSELNVPPEDVHFFKLKVGNGAAADAKSRSTKTSYVDYKKGEGYIYVRSGTVSDISHELGHILGLADRYYEGITWYNDSAIQRTCFEIRTGTWFNSKDEDQRYSVPDKDSKTAKLPRYAERVTLPMHNRGVPDDEDYKPGNNLMSSSSPTLTPYQLEFIGINKAGLAVNPMVEPDLQTLHWVAILGAADAGGPGKPEIKVHPAWNGGYALLYYKDEASEKADKPNAYPCYSRQAGKGKEKAGLFATIEKPELIRKAMRKKRKWIILPGAKKQFANTPGDDDLGVLERDRWCYCVRLLNDLK